MIRIRTPGFLLVPIAILFLSPALLFAQSGAPDKIIPSADGGVTVEYDTNHDGKIDLIVRLNSSDQKVSESMDYNHDGKMDVFYHYRNGVLTSEEVDTNFDGKIDLWLWLADGIYVTKYERDTNFDGKPDIIKVFGSNRDGGSSKQK